MTEHAPILVVFGIDGDGKTRASRFAEQDAELASRAATLLGFRSFQIKGQVGRAIVETLPDGNVFARGNGFVRLVRQTVFDRLAAHIDGGVAATPEQRELR